MAVLPSSTAADCTMARIAFFHAMEAGRQQAGHQHASQRRRRSSDCFLLGWEPPFDCLGVVAGIGAAGSPAPTSTVLCTYVRAK
uniref:Uncharacterized protein n=1 Tax=Oryza meridionalis TaxID=40149 RepID=A0A0E0CXJ6_9ORYZ